MTNTLLPQQILPMTTALVDLRTGKIDKNWWLFLYNMANQTLGSQVDISQVLLLLENQFDSDQTTGTNDGAFVPDVADIPVLYPSAESFATPDVPIANRALPEQSVTLGASAATYTAVQRGELLVQGGTVSLIEVSRNGGTFRTTGLTAGFVPLAIGDRARVTYTVIPTTFFYPS